MWTFFKHYKNIYKEFPSVFTGFLCLDLINLLLHQLRWTFSCTNSRHCNGIFVRIFILPYLIQIRHYSSFLKLVGFLIFFKCWCSGIWLLVKPSDVLRCLASSKGTNSANSSDVWQGHPMLWRRMSPCGNEALFGSSAFISHNSQNQVQVPWGPGS